MSSRGGRGNSNPRGRYQPKGNQTKREEGRGAGRPSRGRGKPVSDAWRPDIGDTARDWRAELANRGNGASSRKEVLDYVISGSNTFQRRRPDLKKKNLGTDRPKINGGRVTTTTTTSNSSELLMADPSSLLDAYPLRVPESHRPKGFKVELGKFGKKEDSSAVDPIVAILKESNSAQKANSKQKRKAKSAQKWLSSHRVSTVAIHQMKDVGNKKERWTQEEMAKAIESGKLKKGELRVNPFNSNVAYATVDGFDIDLLFDGMKRRGCAFHGDTVAISVDSESHWKRMDGSKKGDKKDASNAEEETEVKLRPTGHILGALESTAYTAEHLVTLRYYEQRGQAKVMAVPLDKRFPLMSISEPIKDEKIVEMLKNRNSETNYFYAQYLSWNPGYKHPQGKVLKHVGESGDIDVETTVLLKKHEIPTEDFSNESYEYLRLKFEPDINTETKEWKIPDEEMDKRLDLRDSMIFSIDPITAKDLDDALSITKLEEDIYEIGVHIADVSYFVAEGCPVDNDAKLRLTSTYCVQTVIPMLPRLLCENLCSLNPKVERLAFSCFFKIHGNGQLVKGQEPRMAKTVISSCGKLNYQFVQTILDGETTVENYPEEYKSDRFDTAKIIDACVMMNNIAKNRRKWRFETGSVGMKSNKIMFALDEDKLPTGFKDEKVGEANFLVEEYMLLANHLTAQYIVKYCGSHAILRRHLPLGEGPDATKKENCEDLKTFCRNHDIPLDITSSKTLQESLNQLDKKDPVLYKITQGLLGKAMNSAEYVLTGEVDSSTFHHYCLNLDLYTHFTSPIRRYPDIIAHRLLYLAMQYQQGTTDHLVEDLEKVETVKKCNEAKKNARNAGKRSQDVFLFVYLKNHRVFTEALVTSVETAKDVIRVMIPNFGIEKRIFLKDANIKVVDVRDEIGFVAKWKSAKGKYSKKSDEEDATEDTANTLAEKVDELALNEDDTEKFDKEETKIENSDSSESGEDSEDPHADLLDAEEALLMGQEDEDVGGDEETSKQDGNSLADDEDEGDDEASASGEAFDIKVSSMLYIELIPTKTLPIDVECKLIKPEEFEAITPEEGYVNRFFVGEHLQSAFDQDQSRPRILLVHVYKISAARDPISNAI